jgi:hypothetical protein
MSADELYLHALVRLQSLPQQPYIEYTMDQSSTDPNGNRISLSEIVVERRSDRTSFNAVVGGEMFPLNHVLIGRHYLVPDMLLHAGPIAADAAGALPQIDRLDEQTLKVLVTVKAVPKPRYFVTLAGEATLACGVTEHLTLKPRGDIEMNNVRELWIRPTDYAICQMRYNSKNFEVRHQGGGEVIDVIATMNDDGLVTSWKGVTHYYLPAPGFDIPGEGSFSRFLWTATEPDYYFDEILWTKHANEVKAQSTPHP